MREKEKEKKTKQTKHPNKPNPPFNRAAQQPAHLTPPACLPLSLSLARR
jgi:hypothetical protein